MPVKKVDLQGLIDDLIAEVAAIDRDKSLSRGRQTQAIERAATKFKNRLHDSRRKADRNRIALSTYNRYLTTARREITKCNWKHHTLEDQVARLGARYPEYADRLRSWLDMDIEEMRFAHRDFLREILQSDRAGVGESSDLYQDVRNMKLDHEVMLHLTKNAVQSASFRDQQVSALEEKKAGNARVKLNYKRYVATLLDLLTRPTVMIEDHKVFAFSRLALGVAGATGRRMIEVVYQGTFKKIDKHQLEFGGQAKKRGGSDPADKYHIYTLIDADIVIDAIKALRNTPEAQALTAFDDLDEVERNTQIKRRISKTCNETAKRELAPICEIEHDPSDTPEQIKEKQNRLYKDTRTIYARAAFDLFYKKDPRWKGKDEDVFWRDLLGHEDLKNLQNYKQFELDYSEPELIEDPSQSDMLPQGARLTKLAEFDEVVEQRKAFAKLHEYARERITEDPQAEITKSQLIRFVGSGRKVIEDYLRMVGDILITPEMPDLKGVSVKPKTALAHKKADQPEAPHPIDLLELLRESDEKPRILAVPDGPDGWAAVVMLAGVEVIKVTAHTSQMDAQRAAYSAYVAAVKRLQQKDDE